MIVARVWGGRLFVISVARGFFFPAEGADVCEYFRGIRSLEAQIRRAPFLFAAYS
jgi:hypothetical protein